MSLSKRVELAVRYDISDAMRARTDVHCFSVYQTKRIYLLSGGCA
jgi:hypothetical protein